MKKRQKARFLAREAPSHSNEGKKKEKKKEREKERRRRKKSNGCTLSFIIATLEIWPKKLLDAKGLFGDNVIKSPARYKFSD